MPKKRKVRRVKYAPELVVQRILASDLLLAVSQVLLSSDGPVQAGDVKRRLEGYGIDISTGYVSKLLQKLEKWGVARPFKSPMNGRLLWVAKPSRATELLVAELRKKEAQEVLEAMRIEHFTHDFEEA